MLAGVALERAQAAECLFVVWQAAERVNRIGWVQDERTVHEGFADACHHLRFRMIRVGVVGCRASHQPCAIVSQKLPIVFCPATLVR